MLEISDFRERSWLRWSAEKKEDAKVCIMGVPFDNAASLSKGARKAPDHMRRLSVDLSDTTDEFIPVRDDVLYDWGDISPVLDWEKYFRDVEDNALVLMQTGNFCLFLGGDHSVTIPLHKAFRRYHGSSRLGIIHFDAHYDLCPEYDGHPWSHACTEARALEGAVEGRDLTFVGVRVAEESELEVLREHPDITTVTSAMVRGDGWKDIAERLISKYRDHDAVYITLDIDVLDPAYAPGTGTPVSGGIDPFELNGMIRKLLDAVPVKAMDIVEVSPPLDVNDITSWAAMRVIHEVLTHFSRP